MLSWLQLTQKLYLFFINKFFGVFYLKIQNYQHSSSIPCVKNEQFSLFLVHLKSSKKLKILHFKILVRDATVDFSTFKHTDPSLGSRKNPLSSLVF